MQILSIILHNCYYHKFFLRELLKTQQMYKGKCKQQATDNYPRRFKGIVDDPDVNNWPAPLKLCSQTIQHIKDFRVSVYLNPYFKTNMLHCVNGFHKNYFS